VCRIIANFAPVSPAVDRQLSVYGLLTLFHKPSHTAHYDEQRWGY